MSVLFFADVVVLSNTVLDGTIRSLPPHAYEIAANTRDLYYYNNSSPHLQTHAIELVRRFESPSKPQNVFGAAC